MLKNLYYTELTQFARPTIPSPLQEQGARFIGVVDDDDDYGGVDDGDDDDDDGGIGDGRSE